MTLRANLLSAGTFADWRSLAEASHSKNSSDSTLMLISSQSPAIACFARRNPGTQP